MRRPGRYSYAFEVLGLRFVFEAGFFGPLVWDAWGRGADSLDAVGFLLAFAAFLGAGAACLASVGSCGGAAALAARSCAAASRSLRSFS